MHCYPKEKHTYIQDSLRSFLVRSSKRRHKTTGTSAHSITRRRAQPPSTDKKSHSAAPARTCMVACGCGAAETHASKNSWCAAARATGTDPVHHRTAPHHVRPGRCRRRRAAHGQRPAGHSALCFQSRDGATATRRSWRSASSSMLYPADGERGQLVQSNPGSPRRPVLQWGS